MVTACKFCTFAQYEGKTQTGCYFDRIRKYDEAGYLVQPVYDDEKEFYVIKGAVCDKFRSPDWLKRQDTTDIHKLAERTRFSYDILLYLDSDDIDQFYRQIKAIKDQSIQPNSVLILHPPHIQIQTPKYVTALQLAHFKKWKIESFTPDQTTKERQIDLAALDVTSTYYIIFNLNTKIPEDYIEAIDGLVNEKVINLAMVQTDNSYHGQVVHSFVHKAAGGHKQKSLVDKIREQDKGEHKCLIKIEEIYPQLPW